MMRSLRTKFTLLFLILFVIPFGLLTFLSVSISREMIEQSTISHLRNLAEVKSLAIEQWLRERIGDGKAVAESQEVKSLIPRRIDPYLNLIRHFYQTYQEIWVLDLKGRRISGKLLEATFEKEEWFRSAIENEIYVSRPVLSTPSEPTLNISVAIRDGKGNRIGVLKEVVDMAYVFGLISEAKLGETGELYLVDRDGNFILHKGLEELLRKGMPGVSSIRGTEAEFTHTAIYEDYRGNDVLGSWRWIPGLQCYLVAEQDVKEAFYQIDVLVRRASLIFAVSTLLILGLSFWAVGTVTNPVQALSEAVMSFSEGNFQTPLQVNRKDEIGTLIEGFNTMAEKLRKAYSQLEGRVKASNSELEKAYQTLKQRQEQLIRSEKMAALGQLSAGIAHEIRNPLTSVKIFIQSLEKEIDPDENQREDFRIIRKEIDKINEHINRFLDFARPEEPQFQRVDVRALVMDTLNLLTPKMRTSSIDPDILLPEDLPSVEGDPKQLGQVFLNLILNAIEAMPQGGTLTIHSTTKAAPGSHEVVQLVFTDTGGGIPEKDRPYLYDPFFTTKEGGTGLGLSIVYSIIQKHNGQIEVESELGKGSSFIVLLPVWKEGTWKES